MYRTRKNCVLIVDDETSNILTLTHILSPEYVLYAAKNGQQAIQAAEMYVPDVILLDILMPEMDGYDVLAALKASKATQNIPVIFITGLNDVAAEEKGLAMGVADYITKPFSTAIVKLRLRNQMLAIEQLRSNEYDIMKYKLANDALNIALWDMEVVSEDPVNPNNKFTWSQEFRKMLGFTDENDFPDTLHSWSDRLHPDDKERTLNAFAEHLNNRTGKTPYNIEYRLKLKNGIYRHFQALGTTLRDNNGTAIRTAGAFRDITEEKRMEREIEEIIAQNQADAHWYSSILDAIPLPISVTDANMKWAFVNKATEKFLEMKRDDIIGLPCNLCNTQICNTDECGIVCAKRGQKRVTFNHNERSFQNDTEILYDMDGAISGFIEVAQDVTNVQVLAQQRAEAEMTNRAKSAFLANMSHEIRTPMNAILGVTEIMMQNEMLPTEIEEDLSRIYSSCDMLLGIINDILDFSKIEAGKMDIMPVEYKIASLINDSAQLNIMKIEDKPIEFELQIDENIPTRLKGDELRIKQILNNLLSNAFKYTDAGKVTLSVLIERGETEADVALILSVRDTGHGMTAEQIEKLFDEYSRFNQESNRTIEGTGLGLAITQHLIHLMNGKIFVESEPGVGSLFIVRLPQTIVDSEVLGKELAASLQQFRVSVKRWSRITREPMPYGKILVVDDVVSNHYVAAGLMKPYKLQVDTVISGHAAIDKINGGNEYDIVFMDHMMPDMDGMETTKILRETGYAAPIVALTANAVAGQADLFLQSGFDAFISKPIDVRQLHSALCKYVRDRHPEEAIKASAENSSHTNGESKIYGKAMTQMLDTKIVGLDVLKGFKRYHNDEETYLKIMHAYLASVRPMLGSIEAWSEDGIRAYEITVHGIKGASFDIFADEIGKKAKALEEAAKVSDFKYITEHNPPFIEAARKLIAELDTVLSAIDAENPKPKKDKPDVGALSRLLAACRNYNMDGADDAMAEIEEYQYTSDNGLAVLLRECVDVMDFQKIIEKLSNPST